VLFRFPFTHSVSVPAQTAKPVVMFLSLIVFVYSVPSGIV